MVRSRGGLLASLLLASIAACSSPGPAPLASSTAPPSTTTTIESASTYDPSNVESVSALEGFLTAEIGGDFEASFGLLSKADQEATGGLDGWVAEHYLVVPTIRGFQLEADSTDGTRAEVVADLSLEAGLDQVVGLRPADAHSTWALVEEAGEWRVAFTESLIEPVYLEDTAPHFGRRLP